jgi:hypothetical protein
MAMTVGNPDPNQRLARTVAGLRSAVRWTSDDEAPPSAGMGYGL